MEIYTTQFDNQLKQLDVYKRYPEMLPLIGGQYLNMAKKTLFVGESHYLPSNSVHLEFEEWYKASSSRLNEEEKRWINTRTTSGSGVNQKYASRAFSIFRNIEKGILDSGFDPDLKDNIVLI
jgi:hypothetical protein